MLAAATRLQDTAVALFPVFLFFFLAFGGFIVRLPTLPGYLGSWAPPISFVRWAMEVRGARRGRSFNSGWLGQLGLERGVCSTLRDMCKPSQRKAGLPACCVR